MQDTPADLSSNKGKKISAEEFDAKFETGEDITEHLDLDSGKRGKADQPFQGLLPSNVLVPKNRHQRRRLEAATKKMKKYAGKMAKAAVAREVKKAKTVAFPVVTTQEAAEQYAAETGGGVGIDLTGK
jgi:hypothetical protein